MQNIIPADGLGSDVKSLYLNLSKASGQGFNDSNEVNYLMYIQFPCELSNAGQ